MPASQPTQRADQRRNPDREAFWRQTLSDRLQSGLSIRADFRTSCYESFWGTAVFLWKADVVRLEEIHCCENCLGVR